MPMKTVPGKPLYRVPSMAEIAVIPWNGMTVASTFSGCGGSCLGYRIAGFRVAWANEFAPHAQASYRANAAAGSILDDRDIRMVEPAEILRVLKIKSGQLDVFDGSPPCQAFSTAGQRHKGWGKAKKYAHGAEQCNETLFEHWLRMLRGLRPRAFVAENVSGLIKGTAKGMFIEIIKAMKAAGYRTSCRVLDAQWLGVPQHRQRTIFIGIREDLKDVRGTPLQPCHPSPLPHRYSVREAIPWIGRAVEDTGSFTEGFNLKKDVDFSGGVAPTVRAVGKGQFFVEAESDMTGKATGAEWDRTRIGKASNKYFQLVKPAPDDPCPTVTAAGGNAGLASVCHPTERRKFSIAELKRICAFPDDFVLTGSYAQQWEQLGNSVPPLMMRAIAETLRETLLTAKR